jgi:hypothetical protein
MLSHIVSLPIALLLTGVVMLIFAGYRVSAKWRIQQHRESEIIEFKRLEQELKHEKILLKQSLQYYKATERYLQHVHQQLNKIVEIIHNKLFTVSHETSSETEIFDAFNAYSIFHHQNYHKVFSVNQMGGRESDDEIVPRCTYEITLPKQIREARERLIKKLLAWSRQQSLRTDDKLKDVIVRIEDEVYDAFSFVMIDKIMKDVSLSDESNEPKKSKKFLKNTQKFLIEFFDYTILSCGAIGLFSALQGASLLTVSLIPNFMAASLFSVFISAYQLKNKKRLDDQFSLIVHRCQHERTDSQALLRQEKDYHHAILHLYEENESLKKEIVHHLQKTRVEKEIKTMASHPLLQPIPAPHFFIKI